MSETLTHNSGWAPREPDGRLWPLLRLVSLYLNENDFPVWGVPSKNGPSSLDPPSSILRRWRFRSYHRSRFSEMIFQATFRLAASCHSGGKAAADAPLLSTA